VQFFFATFVNLSATSMQLCGCPNDHDDKVEN